jgi:hypothetical protein
MPADDSAKCGVGGDEKAAPFYFISHKTDTSRAVVWLCGLAGSLWLRVCPQPAAAPAIGVSEERLHPHPCGRRWNSAGRCEL